MKFSQILKKSIVILTSIFVLFFSVALNSHYGLISVEGKEAGDKLTVEFLTVGTGDCIFVKYKNIEMLIDGGEVPSSGKNAKNLKNHGLYNSSDIVSFVS